MTPFVRSRSQRIAAIVAGSLLVAVGFLPLFGGPGYEEALAAGLVLPAAAAIATALDVVEDERDSLRSRSSAVGWRAGWRSRRSALRRRSSTG